jgi:hypothetical protein
MRKAGKKKMGGKQRNILEKNDIPSTFFYKILTMNNVKIN